MDTGERIKKLRQYRQFSTLELSMKAPPARRSDSARNPPGPHRRPQGERGFRDRRRGRETDIRLL